MRGDGRISLWEEEQGRARDGRRRRWITGYCCCPPCRWIRPCSSFPSTAPRCWPRLGEAACARLCGPDPSPPRNWRSCAGEKSHGWLRERKEQQSPIEHEQNLNTSRHTTNDQDRWVDYSTNWIHDDISISRDTHIHMSGSYFTSKSYFAVCNIAVCEKSSKIQYIACNI